jgi:FkbM family methyltransferase
MAQLDDTDCDDPQSEDITSLVARAAALRAQDRPRQALALLLRVLDMAEGHPPALLEMALTLKAFGRSSQARTILSQLVRAGDETPETWLTLGAILRVEGRNAAAEACLRRSLALSPAATAPRLELANLLAATGRHNQAADVCREALALGQASNSAATYTHLGDILTGLERLDEAAEQFDSALAHSPDHGGARLGRSRLALLHGDLTGAWSDAGCRWRQSPRPDVPGQAWDGGDCAGRTILLFAEQWMTDTIQFARLAPLVAQRGAQVVLAVQPALVAVLSALPGIERVLAMGQPVPDGLAFDLNAALPDLPGLLGLTLADLPGALSPLSADPLRHRPILAPPGSLRKIGLAWSGERRDFQIPFPDLAPLLCHPELAFFSLQTGPRAQDAEALSHPTLVTDLSPTIGDFADLAARIAEMDLIIAVDSVAGHLAAALNKPTWMLLTSPADPRWMIGREDSPWYPSLRLFRQHGRGDWAEAITATLSTLDRDLTHLRHAAQDRARAQCGDRVAEQMLLAGHLTAGDVLVDIGAGSGAVSLAAATIPGVSVLAVEARQDCVTALAAHVADLAIETVEIIPAAAAHRAGPAVVSSIPRYQGRRVFPLPDWQTGNSTTMPMDQLLKARPHLANSRLILRLGTIGGENGILQGLWQAMTRHQAAIVVFHHQAHGTTPTLLQDLGYRLFCFPGETAAGPIIPFDGRPGAVLALADGVAPAAEYGDTSRTGPAAAACARVAASQLATAALDAHQRGDVDEAARLYTAALANNPADVDANANLAVLLRRAGRLDAAILCTRRALAVRDVPALWSNLGNALRELGRLDEAESALTTANAALPDDADILYNLALLERDRGRNRNAGGLLERSLAIRPVPARRDDLGRVLLRTGAMAQGFAELAHRAPPPLPGLGRTLLVRDDGDAIDAIALTRFIPLLAQRGIRPILVCPPDRARLLATVPGLARLVTTDQSPPDHDSQIALSDLPHLLGATLPHAHSYLSLPKGVTPHHNLGDGRLHVGLAWAGRAADRFCPLAELLALCAIPGLSLHSLQHGPHQADLVTTGARAMIEDDADEADDLADIAARLAGLDLIIGGDTVETAIAAAMGRPVWVMLPRAADWRWPDGRESTPWFPTVRIFPQSADGTWHHPISRAVATLSALAAAKRG